MSGNVSTRLPLHVGIIMDGNGRWARDRGLSRTEGHREGLKTAKTIVRTAADLGIRTLTLYTFSTENWSRPRREVAFLMGLIRSSLRRELDFYREYGVRVVHSGSREGLSPVVLEELDNVARQTAAYQRITVNLAINYGGRDEIVRSVNRWIAGRNGSRALMTEEDLARNLDQPDLPPADLVIRTGREKRLSNFLLWQCPYAELVFSTKLWPDYTPTDFRRALRAYAGRARRFGGT
jgi:undecaprenyl diphosphate synthase